MENSKRTIYQGNRPFITREILRTSSRKHLISITTHRIFNAMVIGSNPIRPTILSTWMQCMLRAPKGIEKAGRRSSVLSAHSKATF